MKLPTLHFHNNNEMQVMHSCHGYKFTTTLDKAYKGSFILDESENESNIAARWVQRESSIIFTLSSNND